MHNGTVTNMAKDTKYIRKRKRKYGTAFLVEIPYTDSAGLPQRFTKTVRVVDFLGNEKSAFQHAQKVRNDALHDIASGKLRRSYPTVAFLYQQKFVLLPMSIRTKAKQDTIFKSVIEQYGEKPINKVTTADIQQSINQYAEHHSDDAVHRFASIWKQIYKVCSILEYDIQDKSQTVVIPKSKKVVHRRPVTFDKRDFQFILDELLRINSHQAICTWYMLMIMYYTGCRPAEALALTRSDIHSTYISINKSVGSTKDNIQQIVPTKTEGSRRNVPIPHDLLPILKELMQWSKHDLLLADEHGLPQNVSYLSGTIRHIALANGIQFNAYMLRHLMSSELLHAGDSVIARDLLGHSSFAMTLDYARSSTSQLYEAIANRTLAENQPKTKSHVQPSEAIFRRYAVVAFINALWLISALKQGKLSCK